MDSIDIFLLAFFAVLFLLDIIMLLRCRYSKKPSRNTSEITDERLRKIYRRKEHPVTVHCSCLHDFRVTPRFDDNWLVTCPKCGAILRADIPAKSQKKLDKGIFGVLTVISGCMLLIVIIAQFAPEKSVPVYVTTTEETHVIRHTTETTIKTTAKDTTEVTTEVTTIKESTTVKELSIQEEIEKAARDGFSYDGTGNNKLYVTYDRLNKFAAIKFRDIDILSASFETPRLLMYMYAILKELSDNNDYKVMFTIFFPFSDKYGKQFEAVVLTAKYSAETRKKINWDGFSYRNMLAIADEYRLDDELHQYLPD